MKASLLKKLDILHDRFEELTALLGDAEVISDQNRFRAYSKEYAEVEPVIAAYREFRKTQDDLEGAQALLKDGDAEMREMAEEAGGMVGDAVDAFVRTDMERAEAVIARDDLVDADFNAVKARMIAELRRDSSAVDTAIDYLMVAKYLERLGDHAVNICEWTEFYKTGVHQTGR